jgi:membrane-bound inhibitor of C-type lysozyme
MNYSSLPTTDEEQLDEGTFRSEQTTQGDYMKNIRKASMQLFLALALIAAPLAAFQLQGTNALAQSSYFSSRGCIDCHGTPVVTSCNACHYHGNRSLQATTGKTSYAPGETVSVTLTTGSTRSGWIKAILYDQTGAQVAVSSGSASGMGASTTFPATLTAPAPMMNGIYTWKMAYFGNSANSGDVHGEVAVSTNQFTVASAVDTAAPVVSFTLPAAATSLTVPVSSLTATDNVAVTGYLINKSATVPAASAAGWTASAPASVIAVAGANIFYAWAKDAAGNISLSKSAGVTVTLSDTIVPVVGAFTLSATSTSLTVAVSSFTATDNVAVTGYLINKSATVPAASAAGWTASAPTSVIAVAGANTFYAWARDAAGNVSLSKSANVTITAATDITKPTLTISSLADGAYTNIATLNVSGNASDTGGISSVTVNGQAVTINADGSFSYALILTAGANTISTIATDIAGNQQVDTRTVTYETTVPVLTVSAPADNSTTTQSFISITGTISENSTVIITVNSANPQSAAITGNAFNATVNLVAGVNTIDITAVDQAGNTTNAKRTVTYENGNTSFTLSVTNPSQDVTTKSASLTLKGKVVDASGNVKVSITMDGKSYSPKVKDGAFKQRLTFTKAKLYAITVTATDDAGNSSSVVRNVIYRPSNDDHHDNDHQGDDHNNDDDHRDDDHDED